MESEITVLPLDIGGLTPDALFGRIGRQRATRGGAWGAGLAGPLATLRQWQFLGELPLLKKSAAPLIPLRVNVRFLYYARQFKPPSWPSASDG
jgi:hypothetical protein